MPDVNSEKPTNIYSDSLSAGSQNGQMMLEKATQQMQTATDAARGISSEMMRYAGQRLHSHAEHLQLLARCQTPQSFMDQQMVFMRSSVQEITKGMTGLFEAARQQRS